MPNYNDNSGYRRYTKKKEEKKNLQNVLHNKYKKKKYSCI